MDAEDLLAFDEEAGAVGEALWPGVVKIGTVDYACEAPQPRATGSFVVGGEDLDAELVIRIRKTILPVCPKRETCLLFKEIIYVIRSTGGDNAGDSRWILRCQPHN